MARHMEPIGGPNAVKPELKITPAVGAVNCTIPASESGDKWKLAASPELDVAGAVLVGAGTFGELDCCGSGVVPGTAGAGAAGGRSEAAEPPPSRNE